MALLVAFVIASVALFTAWVVGEVRNVRALRLPGAFAPLLLVPIAYFVGQATGHERASFDARAATSAFMGSVIEALRGGNADGVIREAEQLRKAADEPRKVAGSFVGYVESATTRLSLK